MRTHQFGLTIGLFLLMLLGATTEAQRVNFIPATSESKQDTTDEAEMRVQVTMHAWYEKQGNIYDVRSNVSSDVSAEPEGNDTEYDCTAWIKGSADTYSKATPQTENLKPRKQKDRQGQEYTGDSYNDDISYAAIKMHPVSHVTVSPVREKTRNLTLYDSGTLYNLIYSPSQLENIEDKYRPHAWSEVKGVARNNTRPTLDHFWVEVEGN